MKTVTEQKFNEFIKNYPAKLYVEKKDYQNSLVEYYFDKKYRFSNIVREGLVACIRYVLPDNSKYRAGYYWYEIEERIRFKNGRYYIRKIKEIKFHKNNSTLCKFQNNKYIIDVKIGKLERIEE